jgi:DNA primase
MVTQALVADLNERATQFYEGAFAGSPAEGYMLARGISPATLRAWRVGYAPARNGLVAQFQREGIGDGTLAEAGFLSEQEHRSYETFRDRVMLPIMDAAGQVLGFGSRRLDDSNERIPKYKNSPATVLYRKTALVYGLSNLPAIKAAKEVFVVEGNLDLLSLVDAGITNVVAPCGTALTPEQLGLIAPTKSTRITLCYDADPAGRAATRKALLRRETLSADLGVLPITAGLEGAKRDPDDVVRQGVAEAWRILAAHRSSRWNWLWSDTRAPYKEPLAKNDLDAMIAWKDAWVRLVLDYAKNKAEALTLLAPLEQKTDLPVGSLYMEYAWILRKRLHEERMAAKAKRASAAQSNAAAGDETGAEPADEIEEVAA